MRVLDGLGIVAGGEIEEQPVVCVAQVLRPKRIVAHRGTIQPRATGTGPRRWPQGAELDRTAASTWCRITRGRAPAGLYPPLRPGPTAVGRQMMPRRPDQRSIISQLD